MSYTPAHNHRTKGLPWVLSQEGLQWTVYQSLVDAILAVPPEQANTYWEILQEGLSVYGQRFGDTT